MLLQQRCLFFQCPPKFLRGPFRAALSLALRAIDVARPEDAPAQVRLLLRRPPGTLRLTKPEWRSRLFDFQAGRWELLLQSAARCIPATEGDAQPPASPPEQNRRAQPAQPSSPAPWPLCRSTPLPSCATQPGDPPSRTSPWTRRFWNSSLRPLSRSPPTRSLQTCAVPAKEQQRAPVATPRSCAALFWMTKHLVLLSSEQPLISHGRRSPGIAAAIGLGRIVALQKPNGRVRGIVVGDFLRRLVARSLAQFFSSNLQEACQPFQFAAPAGAADPPPAAAWGRLLCWELSGRGL